MELVIQQRDFLRGVARTHAVADKKNSMAILSNLLLSTDGMGSLRLSASDLYVGVSAVVGCEVKKPGTIAIGAKTLFNIVRALPEGEVSLRVDEHGSVELRKGKIKYRIPGFAGEDFPPLPSTGSEEFFTLPFETVGELISMTSFSMLHDDTRPHLAGTLFEGDEGLARMVTTDGHRLSMAEASTSADLPKFRMLVPHKGVLELKRLVDEVRADLKTAQKAGESELDDAIEICTAAGHAFFKRADLQLSVRLADEQFPQYDKVIPQAHTRRMVASRTGLVDSLRRISLVSSDKNGGVELHLDTGSLRIVSQSPEVGEGAEELEVDYDGGQLSVGFNARYLLDALGQLAYDEVALEMNGEHDAGVIRPVGEGTNFVGVIMPIRI